jgi:hypothetical protein
MSGAIQLVESCLPARFVLRWVVAATLPVALSVLLTVGVIQVGLHYDLETWIPLSMLSILSYPLLTALAQGYVMRGVLRRAALWGVLSAAGFVAAMLAVFAAAVTVDALLGPYVMQLAIGLRDVVVFGVPPGMFLKYVISGLLFGTVLGGIQSVVLGPGWGGRMTWTAVSAAASVGCWLWLYLWMETDLTTALPDDISDDDNLLVLLAVTSWSVMGWLLYALPTGFFMQRLQRRRQRSDAEALLRQFD